MNQGPGLLPNFGAEEGRARGSSASASPILEEVAGLWALLFGSEATLLGVDRPAWPAALGPRPPGPAFPWIEDRRRGVAWLSTREAWDELRGEGYAPAMPSPEAVDRAHDKAFALEVARDAGLVPTCLRGHLEILAPLDVGTGVATGRILEWLARLPPWVHGSWTIKPRRGSSGRGRIGGRVAPQSADGGMDGSVAKVSASALARLARRGGAILEPWLERREDLSVQLHIARSGAVEVLGTTRQVLSNAGVYLGTRGRVDADGRSSSGTPWEEEIRRAAIVVGDAAADVGFFGPCGVDAFSFAGPEGEEILRPVVELNARFTMGTVALGLLARARDAGLLEGRSHYLFSLRGAAPVEGVRRLEIGKAAVLLLSTSDELLDRSLAGGGA